MVSEMQGNQLKGSLKAFLRRSGAYATGIASPDSYEKAEEEYHPKRVWPHCRSVVVFAVAMPPEANNTYYGPWSPHDGDVPLGPVPGIFHSESYSMNRLARQIAAPVILAAHAFLEHYGYSTSFRTIQCKLSGYLAGLGVYGKSGLLINPRLGNRMCLGVVMTDALMKPDQPLSNFEPCTGCSICLEKCPAGAYDVNRNYPDSWSRKVCVAKRREIAEAGSYCHNCFALCPAGELSDGELVRIRRMVTIAGND